MSRMVHGAILVVVVYVSESLGSNVVGLACIRVGRGILLLLLCIIYPTRGCCRGRGCYRDESVLTRRITSNPVSKGKWKWLTDINKSCDHHSNIPSSAC